MRAKLQDVRRRVAILRNALLAPSAAEIRRCLPELVEAVRCLSSVEQSLRSQNSNGAHGEEDLARELKTLKHDLLMVHRLIDHSAAFYRGWANLLGAATAGYMPSGEAAPLTAPTVVWMQG
jgi:hypothetical protein